MSPARGRRRRMILASLVVRGRGTTGSSLLFLREAEVVGTELVWQ